MFILNFPNASVSSEEWCYADDVSYEIIVLLFYNKLLKKLVKKCVFSLLAGRLFQIGLFPHKKSNLPISAQNRFVT